MGAGAGPTTQQQLKTPAGGAPGALGDLPQYVNIGASAPQRADHARAAIRYRVASLRGGLAAVEERTDEAAALERQRFAQVYGPPVTVMLEPLGDTPARALHSDAPHPVLGLASEVVLAPRAEATLWFRFGVEDGPVVAYPGALFEYSLARLQCRLPRAMRPRPNGPAEREHQTLDQRVRTVVIR